MKVGIITLGCDKNTVDSERYLGELVAHGAEPAAAIEQADLIVVNTCGFIDAAKKESIDALVAAGRSSLSVFRGAASLVGVIQAATASGTPRQLPLVSVAHGGHSFGR